MSSDQIITGTVTVILAIVAVAVIAALVSPQAKTPGVVSSVGTAVRQMLDCALSPVTGNAGTCGQSGTNVFSTINYGGIANQFTPF